MGRITPADGHWSALIVVVHRLGEKKICLCVDFREINKVTKVDCYPLPCIDLLIHEVSQNRITYLSTMDLKAGFHQVPIAK